MSDVNKEYDRQFNDIGSGRGVMKGKEKKHHVAKKMKKHGGMGKMWEKKSEEQKKYGAWGKRPDGSYPR